MNNIMTRPLGPVRSAVLSNAQRVASRLSGESVAYVGQSSTPTIVASGTAISVPKVGGATIGDLMVMAIIARSAVTVNSAGWTLVANPQIAGTAQMLWVYSKVIVTAADRDIAASVSQATANVLQGAIFCFRGTGGSTPVVKQALIGTQSAVTTNAGIIVPLTPTVVRSFAMAFCTPTYPGPGGGIGYTPSAGWTSCYPALFTTMRLFAAVQRVNTLAQLTGTMTANWAAATGSWFNATLEIAIQHVPIDSEEGLRLVSEESIPLVTA